MRKRTAVQGRLFALVHAYAFEHVSQVFLIALQFELKITCRQTFRVNGTPDVVLIQFRDKELL